MDTDLLATKLAIPPLAHGAIARERLVERLERGLATARLALVSAPAGYGKTTLLAQWARASAVDIAWLTCGAADNDPNRFLRYLVSAWAATWPEIRASRLGAMLGGIDADREEVLDALVHTAGDVPRPTAIVLDDFHLITDPDIHRALTLLLDHMPSMLHLVLSTREEPPMPLARLRARQELVELRVEDVRLRRDETDALLAAATALELPAEQLGVLHDRLEGWAAGVQLVACTVRQPSDLPDRLAISGRQRHIADYLREEVLEALPDDTRRFLLQTSILDRLSGPLCEHLTGNHRSQEMLESLERANLFLMPLDDNRTWFRYHALFADLLRDELAREDADAVATLHRRAAGWYLDHDLPEPAFAHARAGEDVVTVDAVLNRYLTIMLFSGEGRLATRWIEAIPREWYDAYTPLLLQRAAWLLITGQWDAGSRTLAEAERRVAASRDGPDATAARITAMRCFIACFRGDLAEAQRYASEALETLPAGDVDYVVNLYHALGDTCRANGRWDEATAHYLKVLDIARREPRDPTSRLFAVHVYGAMADLELRQGHVRQAASFWTRAMEAVEAPEVWGRYPLPVTGWVYLRLGELSYEWNDLARAREAIAKGLERAELGGDARATIAGKVILARLELTDGHLDAAETCLAEARALLDDAPFADWWSRYERCRVDLWLARDELRAATEWVDAVLATGELDHRADAEPAWLAVARVLVHRGDPDAQARAREVLDRLVLDAGESGRSGVLVEALALRALAHEQRGNQAAALTDLEQAVRMAQPEGYTRLFVDFGTPMRWLLGEARARGVLPGAITRLIAAFGDVEMDRPAAASEPLTDRERDVVRLLAAGLTNREIADALFVSPETVKKHIANVFGKLGVRNRVEAVTRARALTIID